MPESPLIAQQHLRVELDSDQERFNLFDGQSYIGFLGFHRDGTVLDLQHTIVKEEFSRRGYARALVAIVLERVWGREEQIIPTCSYVVDFLSLHPQYAHLVAAPVAVPVAAPVAAPAASPVASPTTEAPAEAAPAEATPSGTRPKGRHSA